MTLSVDQYHFPSIDSTNSWAKKNAAHLKTDHLTIVTAGSQTAGRGRHKRHWVSPPDVNLYASYCLFVPEGRKDIANLPQVVALATAQLLEGYELPAQLKWPNDILIDEKKVGGVLCETTPVKEKIAVIVGLGLNINMSKTQLQQIDKAATSLTVEAKRPFDLLEVTEELQGVIQPAIEKFLSKGFKPFVAEFRHSMLHRLGDTMRFHLGDKVMEGSFHSINDDGTLNLILDDQMHSISSGEVLA